MRKSGDDLETTRNKWWKLLNMKTKKTDKWWKLDELVKAAAKVIDEQQRAKKETSKSKVVSEEEEEEDDKSCRYSDYYVSKKIRTWLRYPQQSYENLNGASTSSSSLHQRRWFETRSSLHYNMAETKSPRNPDSQYSQSSYTSRKRRAVVPQRSSSGKFKKAEVAFSPQMARDPPGWLVQMRISTNRVEDPRLIFERPLTPSDVQAGQSRLLLPFNKLIRNDFLTRGEYRAIMRKDLDDENIGLGTILVNERSITWGLRFKTWVMEKKNSEGEGTWNYILNWGWNDVVKANDLRADDEISIWSFRCGGLLCFALEHRVLSFPAPKD